MARARYLHTGVKRCQVVIRNSAWIIFHTKIQGVCIYAIIAPCRHALLLSDAEHRGAARASAAAVTFRSFFRHLGWWIGPNADHLLMSTLQYTHIGRTYVLNIHDEFEFEMSQALRTDHRGTIRTGSMESINFQRRFPEPINVLEIQMKFIILAL